MAQFWYKKDKRVQRLSDDASDKSVVAKVKKLKADGYVKVTDRFNPEASIIKTSKPKAKPKAKKEKK